MNRTRSQYRGMFLCLDGMDGAGKSTQLSLVANWLKELGNDVVVCRDPGGTPAGDEIRNILLGTKHTVGMMCEMLLYQASRAQLMEEVVAPALAANRIVLCDRFLLSTIVYQGYGGGVAIDAIRSAGMIATKGVLPEWTAVLDVSPKTSVARRKGPADRIESRSVEFYERVRNGFLMEAKAQPERICVIDAEADIPTVYERIKKELTVVLAKAGRT